MKDDSYTRINEALSNATQTDGLTECMDDDCDNRVPLHRLSRRSVGDYESILVCPQCDTDE